MTVIKRICVKIVPATEGKARKELRAKNVIKYRKRNEKETYRLKLQLKSI